MVELGEGDGPNDTSPGFIVRKTFDDGKSGIEVNPEGEEEGYRFVLDEQDRGPTQAVYTGNNGEVPDSIKDGILASGYAGEIGYQVPATVRGFVSDSGGGGGAAEGLSAPLNIKDKRNGEKIGSYKTGPLAITGFPSGEPNNVDVKMVLDGGDYGDSVSEPEVGFEIAQPNLNDGTTNPLMSLKMKRRTGGSGSLLPPALFLENLTTGTASPQNQGFIIGEGVFATLRPWDVSGFVDMLPPGAVVHHSGTSDIPAGLYSHQSGGLRPVKNPTGKVQLDGDGSKTTFTVTHNAGIMPEDVFLQAASAASAEPCYVENLTSTSFDIVFKSAPPSGSGNIKFSYEIKPQPRSGDGGGSGV